MPGYSPVLAIITGLMEFAAAVFTFLSPGRKRILCPVGLLFLLLAGYQFAEVAGCSNPHNLLFVRIAFFDITWLPPISLWLAVQLRPSKNTWLKVVTLFFFAAALAFSVWILIDPTCITKSVCQLVIARYYNLNPFDTAYAIFYQSGHMILIFGSAAMMAHSTDTILRKHLVNLQIGILGFVIPSLALRIWLPEPEGILPSVMCHFALVLAVSLFALVIRERRFSLRTK